MSGFDLGTLRTDKIKEVEGVWMEFAGTSKVLVARFRNSKMEEWLISNQTNATRRMLDPKMGLETLKQAVSKFVLLGWTELSVDGKKVEYSEEKALELFNDFPDFYETILVMSQERDAFRDEKLDIAKGNLPKSSSGSQSGDAQKKG